MLEIRVELDKDSLLKVQHYIDNKEWRTKSRKSGIKDDWESNLGIVTIYDLEDGGEVPFIYFHLQCENDQVFLQAEWYVDGDGVEFFRSPNVDEILNAKIEVNDSVSVVFKTGKDGFDLTLNAGKEMHEMCY